jgi:hypothetical protein
MAELTETARKIMALFGYFRLVTGNYRTVSMMITKKHLWRDIEEETFQDAIRELIERGYIAAAEDPPGWQLLEAGAKYIGPLRRGKTAV